MSSSTTPSGMGVCWALTSGSVFLTDPWNLIHRFEMPGGLRIMMQPLWSTRWTLFIPSWIWKSCICKVIVVVHVSANGNRWVRKRVAEMNFALLSVNSVIVAFTPLPNGQQNSWWVLNKIQQSSLLQTPYFNVEAQAYVGDTAQMRLLQLQLLVFHMWRLL